MKTYFNGTHLIRIHANVKGRLPLTVETAEADAEGNQQGEWTSPSQTTWWRDMADALCAALIEEVGLEAFE